MRFRNRDTVGEQVVDAKDAGGAEKSEPRRLHRRGLPREDRQAVVSGVARELDQDLDAVGADQGCRRFVADVDDAVPGGEARLDARGEVVLLRERRIGEELDAGGIEMRDHALDDVAADPDSQDGDNAEPVKIGEGGPGQWPGVDQQQVEGARRSRPPIGVCTRVVA